MVSLTDTVATATSFAGPVVAALPVTPTPIPGPTGSPGSTGPAVTPAFTG